MGGKGGGGQMQDTGLGAWINNQFDQDAETGWLVNKNNGMVWENINTGPNKGHKDVVFADRNKPKEEKPAEAVKEEVQAPEPVKQATPDEAAAATPDPTLTPPDSIGDTLGGAVKDPPAYFVGGIEDYNKAKNAKGSMTTTQT